MPINTTEYFYYEITRKVITVFGAMFNNIHTGRKLPDGTLTNTSRVPLSYGPRSKFLARINEYRDGEVSIKLPRLSFEISSLALDEANKLKKNNRVKYCPSDDLRQSAFAGVPYNITFELSIFGRSQDDMFQVLEQILPHFSPEYTVSIKDIEGPGTVMDVPFKLTGVSLSDEYEGDFKPARPLIYTLTFDAKVKYLGPISSQGQIKTVTTNFVDPDNGTFFEKVVVKGELPNEITLCEVNFVDSRDEYDIVVDSVVLDVPEGSEVVGETSGYGALVESHDGTNTIRVHSLDNVFTVGENLLTTNSQSYQILSIERV
jgi:hypothetical protein